MADFTVIVPFWNGHDTLPRLLESIPRRIPVIVVDDHSDEPLRHVNRKNTRIVKPPKKGYFSGAVNAGARACAGDFLIVNQDAWFDGDGWLDFVAQNRKRCATFGHGVMRHKAWALGYVQGTFMYVRHDAWERVGELNVRDYPLWGATCEWQLRACRAGYEARPVAKVPDFRHDEARRGERRKYGRSISQMLRRKPHLRKKLLGTPPLVTVVVPCYNYGRYLADAVNSLIGGETCLGDMPGQTFQGFEVVIVDDASTDDSWEIAKALADPWKGIRAIRQKSNRGTPATLNRGVRAAMGEYIHILSADDMREDWCLRTLLRACQDNPHSVAYGDITIVTNGKRKRSLKLPDYDFEKVLRKNPMPAGLMYPKKAWREVGGYPAEMRHGREDWAFNIALGARGWCGVHVGHSGNLYRRDRQNRSLQTSNVHKGEIAPTGTKDWRAFFRKQLRGLYPALYKGVRPVGCCGSVKSGARNNPGPRVNVEQQLPGQGGMVVLKYVGLNDGLQTFTGAVSGTKYVFGRSKPRGYVAVEDVPAFLDMRKKRRKQFVRAPVKKPEPKPVEKKAPLPKAKAVEIVETDIRDLDDDLTVLRGVGETMARKLRYSGFDSVRAVAEAVPGELAESVKGVAYGKAMALISAAQEYLVA